MRRYAFGIVGTALALVVLPCLLLLTVDMEERRIAPLAGRWASVLHPGATADISRGPECYILTLRGAAWSSTPRRRIGCCSCRAAAIEELRTLKKHDS